MFSYGFSNFVQFWLNVRGHSTTTGTEFSNFWSLPPPPAWTVFMPWAWTKTDIFWPPPPAHSSCPRKLLNGFLAHQTSPMSTDSRLVVSSQVRTSILSTPSTCCCHEFNFHMMVICTLHGCCLLGNFWVSTMLKLHFKMHHQALACSMLGVFCTMENFS
jgi:hypothetical protein